MPEGRIANAGRWDSKHRIRVADTEKQNSRHRRGEQNPLDGGEVNTGRQDGKCRRIGRRTK